MPPDFSNLVEHLLEEIDPSHPEFATLAVDRLIAKGRAAGVSDLHLQPTETELVVHFRADGVLHSAGAFPVTVAPNVVARLKVLAGLLTYRTEVPQEGRIRDAESLAELRVSTFPTLYGERAVVRFFPTAGAYRQIDDLGLPDGTADQLRLLLAETSGAILTTGPAGSGKTTTVYACLRHLVAASGFPRSIVSIEDPIEVAVEGVAQSQVNENVDLDLATGLRFLMRQDPEVIAVGEIRDRQTAEAALQASLTGHLLFSTFHAGSAAEAISRLADMGIEPYLLRSGILGILSQRLVRRLCTCARPIESTDERLALPVQSAHRPVGCELCGGSGYRGRMLLVEMLTLDRTELGRAILSRSDSGTLERLAVASGMVSRWQRALNAVEAGHTSPAEIRRVLGLGSPTI